MNFIISGMDLNAGLALGIMFIVTWMISIGGILQRFHNTMGLVITNWALIADAIGVLSVGGTVWFYTLREKSNFLQQWEQASPQLRQGLQDQLGCCGFTNSTQLAVNAGFCTDLTFAASQVGCSTIILPKADYTLENIFSSVFGLMAVVIAFFLASVCMVYRRQENERFRRIDEKRGKAGFA